MKRVTKKLALSKEVVRGLADGALAIAQGGRINQSVSLCEGGRECHPVNTLLCATGP